MNYNKNCYMKLQGIEFNNKWYMKLLQIRQKNWKEERKKKKRKYH